MEARLVQQLEGGSGMQDGGVRTSGGGALPAFAARGGADRRGHRSAHGCLDAAAAASALSVKTGIDLFF